MRLRAKRTAFINGQRIRKGEVVDLPEVKKCPLWAEQVDAKAETIVANQKDKPTTLRDLAKSGEKIELVGDTKPASKA